MLMFNSTSARMGHFSANMVHFVTWWNFWVWRGLNRIVHTEYILITDIIHNISQQVTGEASRLITNEQIYVLEMVTLWTRHKQWMYSRGHTSDMP